jgi:hypothetical protein
MPVIFDLEDQSGVAEIKTDDLTAIDRVERDPKRYVKALPPNVKLGPKRGLDRIML